MENIPREPLLAGTFNLNVDRLREGDSIVGLSNIRKGSEIGRGEIESDRLGCRLI